MIAVRVSGEERLGFQGAQLGELEALPVECAALIQTWER
jgi:hypothetical protein